MARLPVHTRAAATTDIGSASLVTSVFARVGAVVAAAGDYAASKITNDSSTVSGTYVSNALDALKASITALVAGVSSFNARAGAVVPVAGDYAASKISNDSGVVGTYVKDALDTINAAYVRLAGDLGNTVLSPRVDKIRTIAVSSTAPTQGQGLVYQSVSAQYEPRGQAAREFTWNGTNVSQFTQIEAVGAGAGGASSFATYISDATKIRGGKINMVAAHVSKRVSIGLINTQTFALGNRYRVYAHWICQSVSTNRLPGIWFLGDGTSGASCSGFIAGPTTIGGTGTSLASRVDSGTVTGSSIGGVQGGWGTTAGLDYTLRMTVDLFPRSNTAFDVMGIVESTSTTKSTQPFFWHTDATAYAASGGAIVTGSRIQLGFCTWSTGAIGSGGSPIDLVDFWVDRLP